MLDPGDLLAVARSLCSADDASPAALRRAVSTGYYALFHAVLRAAAGRYADDGSAAYALLYRSFEHGQMRAACEVVGRGRFGGRLEKTMGRAAVSEAARDFALGFVAAQERRMTADHEPRGAFDALDVRSGLAEVERALDAFGRIPAEERADLLALLMVRARG